MERERILNCVYKVNLEKWFIKINYVVICIWRQSGVEIEWTKIMELEYDLGNKMKKRWLILFL